MAGRQDDEDVRTCGRVTGPRRRACAALARLRAAPAAAAGLKRAPEGLFHASRRAGTVQMHGAFAVFGQVVVITWGCGGSQAGLPKQNDAAQEGERMHERMSVAERVLQAVPGWSSKN